MADGSVSYRVSPQIRQFYGPWGATESLTIGTGGVIASATGSYFFLGGKVQYDLNSADVTVIGPFANVNPVFNFAAGVVLSSDKEPAIGFSFSSTDYFGGKPLNLSGSLSASDLGAMWNAQPVLYFDSFQAHADYLQYIGVSTNVVPSGPAIDPSNYWVNMTDWQRQAAGLPTAYPPQWVPPSGQYDYPPLVSGTNPWAVQGGTSLGDYPPLNSNATNPWAANDPGFGSIGGFLPGISSGVPGIYLTDGISLSSDPASYLDGTYLYYGGDNYSYPGFSAVSPLDNVNRPGFAGGSFV